MPDCRKYKEIYKQRNWTRNRYYGKLFAHEELSHNNA